MKICFVSPEYFPISGGTGAYVYYLSRKLQKLGYNVHVVARHTVDSTEIVDGVNVNYVKGVGNSLTRYWRFARAASRKLKELNRKFGFDIVHSNLPLVPSFAIPEKSANALISTVHSTWKGEAEAIRRGSRRKLNPNEKLMLRFNSLLRSYEKKLMKRSDALIAVSLYTKKELTELYDIDEEKIHVVYNGVDTQKFRPNRERAGLRLELGLEEKHKIILCVGRLYYRKGITILLKSIPEVVQKFEDVRFIISGKGFKKNEENLRKLTQELDIEKHVMFLGYVPDEKLPDLYAASDIFVLPALYENFPFAILEAQSTGLPVISTKVGGIPEFLRENKNGFLVEPGDPEQLAQKIMTLLKDPELAEELGKCGRNLVEEKFAWPLITNQVVDLYQRISNTS
ncbi:MAG: glycosyltransferase family 4 protein [Candidatus Bathyarchaeota archaeon]|nr:MAG: glycosyltransferase family 4 protein [Candidatus Bathyarchaeota archaeon]